VGGYNTLFKPLIEYLHECLLSQPVIPADEITLNVLNEDKAKYYMKVYCTGSESPIESKIKNIVLYDYKNSRAGNLAVNFLKRFEGYLQADGYRRYALLGVDRAGCMAYARHKFVEA